MPLANNLAVLPAGARRGAVRFGREREPGGATACAPRLAPESAAIAKSGMREAIEYFSDPVVCLETVSKARWPSGPVCPRCDCRRLSFLKTRLVWTCLECRKQFSVKVGTIFEDSPIGLDKWLAAMWLVANHGSGFSSYEAARDLSVTQRTAWFMLHRIRYAMRSGVEFPARAGSG
jgi:transposase-like protein